MKRNHDCNDITMDQIQKEIERMDQHRRHRSAFKRFMFRLLMFAAVAAVVMGLWFPVYRVSGQGMEPALSNGDFVLGVRSANLERGDVAACDYENTLILRRVIAQSGDLLEVNFEGKLTVNGRTINSYDPQVTVLGLEGMIYPFEIPEGYCLLGSDSANVELILLKPDKPAAKILCRFRPPRLPW